MSDFDWIAEAKRMGMLAIGATPHAQSNHFYRARIRPHIDVDGFGTTEQLAARDAVLRFREAAKRALPEYEELLAAVRSWASDMEGRGQPLLDVLARIDAKQGQR